MRNIWITGAGKGIGRETALTLAVPGNRLYLTSRNGAELEKVARQCREAGAEAHAIRADVRDEDEMVNARAQFDGAVDALVACAGTGTFGPTVDQSLSVWNEMIETNLTGAFLAIRESLRSMLPAGEGKIVVVGSVAGARVAFPSSAAYCASKAGVVALANSVREEMRGTGIRVNVVIPGAVASTFWEGIEGEWDFGKMIPVARVAREIARVLNEDPDGTLEEIVLLPPGGNL